jgi:hypothetical protein
MDGDASVMARICKEADEAIIKLEDRNHIY